MIMGDMYYAYHMMLLWPWFIMEGMTGLSFYTHGASSIDEVDEISNKMLYL